MPGGRLTNQDRRRIAAGLTAGLGYAEIARKLGRPTSTVSREVTRNGGGAEYRADRAHRATGQRARRTPPAMGPAAGTPDAVRGFVDEFAALMVHTGLPRMAARVFTALVTTDSGALTAAELVGGLRVSPASVSKAVGYLEGLDLVRRERDQRRERYVIDEDLWLRTWLTSARTNAALADTAQRGTEVFPATTPTGARLDHMRRFFAQLSEDMAGGPDGLDDLLTVAAALVHAAAPRTAAQVAAALGWPVDRVAGALRDAESRPDQTDPVAVRQIGGGAYAVTVKPGRLTAAQCSALGIVQQSSFSPYDGTMLLRRCGSDAVLVEVDSLDEVSAVRAAVRAANLPDLVELVPAARTVLISVRPGTGLAPVRRVLDEVDLSHPAEVRSRRCGSRCTTTGPTWNWWPARRG